MPELDGEFADVVAGEKHGESVGSALKTFDDGVAILELACGIRPAELLRGFSKTRGVV